MDINLIGDTLKNLSCLKTAVPLPSGAQQVRAYVDYEQTLLAMRTLFARQEKELLADLDARVEAVKKLLVPQKQEVTPQVITPVFEVGTLVLCGSTIRIVLEREEKTSQKGNIYYNYRVGSRTGGEGWWVYGNDLVQYDA